VPVCHAFHVLVGGGGVRSSDKTSASQASRHLRNCSGGGGSMRTEAMSLSTKKKKKKKKKKKGDTALKNEKSGNSTWGHSWGYLGRTWRRRPCLLRDPQPPEVPNDAQALGELQAPCTPRHRCIFFSVLFKQ